MRATVLGAAGFVGAHLVRHLRARGYEVRAVARGDETWRLADLGHVFYCIGLTADFRTRPFDTMDAHVSVLAEVLQTARCESLLYLSSTRLYRHAEETSEDASFRVRPGDPDHLYDLSKLAGEALCHAAGRPDIRIARLSNVVGPGDRSANFLTTLLDDAITEGAIHLRSSAGSSKDYIWVDDAVAALEAIAISGAEPVYNVASGRNLTNLEIAAALSAATRCSVTWEQGAPELWFPPIDVRRLRTILPDPGTSVLSRLGELVADFRMG